MSTSYSAPPRRGWFANLRFVLLVGSATILMIMILAAFGSNAAQPTSGGGEMSWPLIGHLVTAVPALALGAYLFLARKGDARHKFLGKIQAVLMVATAIASLGLGHGVSFIHFFSILTLFCIPYAIWQVRRGNVDEHRRVMSGLYIGTVIAGLLTFLPGRFMGNMLFG